MTAGNEEYKVLPQQDESENFKHPPQKSLAGSERRDILYQGFASLVAYSLAIHAGINLAISTVLHPQLEVTKEQASWIASLGAIGTPIGSIGVGFVMDRIGRQKTLVVACAPIIVAWTIFCLLPSEFDIRLIYLARFMEGFGAGMTSISIVYVAETTNKHWRPLFLSFNSIAVSAGILLTTTIGVLLAWRAYALFCLSMATVSAIVCLTLPESPSWLVQFDPELAKKELARLNTSPKDFDAEWNILESKLKKAPEKKERKFFTSDKKIIRPLAMVLALLTLQQLVGIYPTIFYALELFQKVRSNVIEFRPTTVTASYNLTTVANASNVLNAFNFTNTSLQLTNATNVTSTTPVPSSHVAGKLELTNPAVLALMSLGCIRFVVSIVMTMLSKKFGVRSLLIFSSFGIGVSSVAFAFHQVGWCSQSSDTVSFAIILCFITFGSLGLMVIPWTLVGEVLPMEFRGVGQGISVAYAFVVMFFVVKFYPFIEDELGTSLVFLIFGSVAFVTVGFVYFFVPDTLGKTMDEIQTFFVKR